MNCPDCKKPAKLTVNGFNSRLTYYYCSECGIAVEDKINEINQAKKESESDGPTIFEWDVETAKSWTPGMAGIRGFNPSFSGIDDFVIRVKKNDKQDSNPPDSLL